MARDTDSLLRELQQTVDALRRRVGNRPRMFSGLCALCGEPSGRSRYCGQHVWMVEQADKEWAGQ